MTYGNVAVKYTTWQEEEGTGVREQYGPEHTVLAGSTALTQSGCFAQHLAVSCSRKKCILKCIQETCGMPLHVWSQRKPDPEPGCQQAGVRVGLLKPVV